MNPDRWQRVAQLYDLVLEREPSERDAFLAAQSGEDADLRREVQSLLAQDNERLLLDEPMLDTAAEVLDEYDLKPGSQLGPYCIDASLGAGGMGQVYRATDTRLNRTVAIKVLPQALARDPQFRARFDREAHVIAALNHPHICTLYDVGQHKGLDFLVMEYLEGDTLARRLDRGPLPLDTALSLVIDIADALSAAHSRGIVHRDLKPGNIVLTSGGAKLVDFGIARPAAPVVVHGEGGVPVATPSLTMQGAIIGTLQYMAPEQLEGREPDARTDLFAFGAVLYEMLTGKKAFEAKSQASLIGAIMQGEPASIATIQPLTPPSLEHIIRRCLAKQPDDRWQSARDLWHELQCVSDKAASRRVAVSTKYRRLALTIATLVGIGVFAVGIRQVTNPKPVAQVARFTIAPPAGTSLPMAPPFSPEISPDGRRLVFRVMRGATSLLAVRSLDALEAQVLAGTEGATSPFWSPDSRVIAFFAAGKLRKVAASGGPIQVICDVRAGLGGTWNREETIVFLSGGGDGLFRVPAAGGAPTALSSFSHADHHRPIFLPDGRRFLYFVAPDAVYLASIDGGPSVRVPVRTDAAVYAPPGYLVHRQGSALVAQRFDSNLSKPLEDPVLIAEEAVPAPVGAVRGSASFSTSENGVLAYAILPPQRTTTFGLGWFARDGRALGTVEPFPFETFGGIQLSPDGTHLATQSPQGPRSSSEIWLFDLLVNRAIQLTFSEGSDRAPIWSPDGKRLAFASLRAGAPGLYQKIADGGQPERQLLPSGITWRDENWPEDWSATGIVYVNGKDPDSDDIWMLPIDGSKPYPLVREPGRQLQPKLSRDGKWLAYVSQVPPSLSEVFVASVATPGAKWRVSTGGVPRWSRDGKELFYVASDGMLMALPVEADSVGVFRPGAARALFQMAQMGSNIFDVAPDGQRFLVKIPKVERGPSTGSIAIVTNWPPH